MPQKSGTRSGRVGNVRIVPVYIKIVSIFVFFLLLSNLSSNFVNLMLGRDQQLQLMNELLGKELKEMVFLASSQADLLAADPTRESDALKSMEASARNLTKRPHAMGLALDPLGRLLFFASPQAQMGKFEDPQALKLLNQDLQKGQLEGRLDFNHQGKAYFGFYQFHKDWKAFFIRAESVEEFNADTWNIFLQVILLIVLISLTALIMGIFILRSILKFISQMTRAIMDMHKTQDLGMIDMKGAPNDDVTYLGLSFNALSGTIRNLLGIFRKFVSQDLAQKAYKERQIRLEGQRMNLTMLFSDIKGFTYMTETLGNDIIKLLNLHYDKAIRHIQDQDGTIGSIIGDALLAVFGTLDSATHEQKSVKAIRAAYAIQKVAAELRQAMMKTRESILRTRGALTSEEEKIYRAVLIEVGVGIDAGEVFYGTIGSYVRMTNTVIGDNVNSASRLEGLTRIYKAPVIVSEAVKDEVVALTQEYYFLELDTVQVKGKTEGKKIFWPVERKHLTPETERNFDIFQQGLREYYQGQWRQAEKTWATCITPYKEVFLNRITGLECPPDWNGIWTMTSK